MSFAAFDLSKRSTGFAVWQEGWEKPRFGHWVLGGEYTTPGGCFAKLHACLMELHRVMPWEHMAIEEPLHPAQLSGSTNIATIKLCAGLAAHAASFAHAFRCRSFREINVESWRRDFLSADLISDARADARKRKAATGKGSARDKLKALTMERCRQLGFDVRTDDEADACGLLDYFVAQRGIVPPWRRANVLIAPLEAVS